MNQCFLQSKRTWTQIHNSAQRLWQCKDLDRHRGVDIGMSRNVQKTSKFQNSSIVHKLVFEWIDFEQIHFGSELLANEIML
jgi:hypothetical protein